MLGSETWTKLALQLIPLVAAGLFLLWVYRRARHVWNSTADIVRADAIAIAERHGAPIALPASRRAW